MKWKCATSQLLSIPVAVAAVGFGMNEMCLGADDTSTGKVTSQVSPDKTQSGAAVLESFSAEIRSGRLADGKSQQLGGTCGVPQEQHFDDTGGPSVRCGSADNKWARSWNPGELTQICAVEFPAFFGDSAGDVEVFVRIYTGNVTGPFGDLNLIGEASIMVGPDDLPGLLSVSFDPPVPIPGDEAVVVSVEEASAIDFIFEQNEGGGESADSYLASDACGITDFTPFSAIGFGDLALIMTVFDQNADVTGACCRKEMIDGEIVDTCEDDVSFDECDGVFRANVTCAEAVCPTQVECPEGDACPDCQGDLNDTGVIDGADLLVLLGCWGPVDPGCECADFNNDSNINGADLLVLLGGWGTCPAADGPGGDVIDENEACGDRDNDGCNVDPPAFGPALACGDTVCGTAWTAVEEGAPTRDTDWYPFTVKETKQTVTWSVHAEFPAQAIIGYAPDGCVEDAVIIASAQSEAKVPFEISACVQPDVEYFLFVSPSGFEGLPCDAEGQWGDAYTAEVVCDEAVDCPKGACCLGETCLDNSDPFVCETIEGGIYLGDGTDCADDPCVIPVGACCFNDGTCQMAAQDECINTLEGAYRGNGTTCDDMVPLDINCDGNEEMVGICRDCGEGAQTWCNLQDQCDENIDQDPFNGGCNYFDPETLEFEAAFEEVCCGDLVGGRVWSIEGEGRDLDWRVLNIKEPTAITMTLNHSFGNVGLDGIIFLADSGCPSTIIQTSTGPDGVVLFRLLDPGTYYVIVTTDFVDGGDNLLCDSPDSVYTLDIACGTQQTDICNGNCSGIFLEHPGYPQGVCSCDPAFCVGFSGDDPNQTEFCCPGVCTFCEEFGGVCDVPDNAFCADAIPIADGLTEYSTIGAPTDGPENPAGLCNDFGQNQTHNDIWYTYEATCTGELLVTTCEDLGAPPADYDTDLVIYSTTNCGALEDNLLACNDDDPVNSCGTEPPWASTIMTNVTQGTEYLIRVGGWGPDDEGNGTLLIECTPDP